MIGVVVYIPKFNRIWSKIRDIKMITPYIYRSYE